jgi:glutathione peroxidase
MKPEPTSTAADSVHAFTATRLDGQPQALADYAGKVLLIVNTASRCGFTPQYAGLQALYEQYGEQGLVVLGFPCNQFGGQEPGSDSEIASFCDTQFQVRFPMYAKVEVNGPNEHPLFAYLKRQARGVLGSKRIKWNFTKFLVDRQGRVLRRFAPACRPEQLAAAVQAAL